jgi:N-acetylmuramoyl-L-alanine amidase
VPTPLATPIARRPVVALDPGHGGPDDDLPRADRSGRLLPWYREGDNSGAIFRSSDGSELREKDLTLRLALATADLLEAEDVLVVLTRRGDVPVNLEKRDLNDDGKVDLVDELLARIDLVNRAQADLLVSIHLNAHPSPSMRGTYANYASERPFTRESIRLAVTLHRQVLRGIRELSPRAVDRGVEDDVEGDPAGRHLLLLGSRTARAPFETTMPGALIEPLFMTNPEDVELLRRADLLDAVARSLADGVLEYLRES